MNGNVNYAVTNSVTSTTSMTVTVSMEIGIEVASSTLFGGSKLSAKITTSLANTWENSYSISETTTFNCDNYDTGEAFTGGCMW
jgi:hypothetical protein